MKFHWVASVHTNDKNLSVSLARTNKSVESLVSRFQESGELPVSLHGYLGERSDLSKRLSFVPLRDSRNARSIQLVSAPSKDDPAANEIHEKLRSINANSPVAVRGILRQKRNASSKNDGSSSQGVSAFEVSLTDEDGAIECLNEFPSDIIVKPDTQFQQKARYLQIRYDSRLKQSLEMRAKIQFTCRKLLHERVRATDVETPLLFKSTSEGAREFIVPTRRKGYSYALPQSPQQFKQILMSAGIPRYYQFARCFRDEDLRTDRQPEFTQIDMEMAFVDGEEVMHQIEDHFVRPLWESFLSIRLPQPFRKMTYAEAIASFGSDKPDLRIPISSFTSVQHVIPVDLVQAITKLEQPIIEAMVVALPSSPPETRAFAKEFFDSPDGAAFNANSDGVPGVFIYDSSKPLHGLSAFGFEAVETVERSLDLEDGHLIILQARPRLTNPGSATSLGNMRTGIFHAAVKAGLLPPHSWEHFEPLWVVGFPLFTPRSDGEAGQGRNVGFMATHHPFTSPKSCEDVDMLLKDPTQAFGDQYDLVINGEEIGGGSRRIHQSAMQEFVFRDILKMEDSKIQEFSHLLEALRAGCPPHAGIALGFDRLVAMLVSSKLETKLSMRDVIAFPKTGKGEDPVVGSPGLLSAEDLETYHLQLKDD